MFNKSPLNRAGEKSFPASTNVRNYSFTIVAASTDHFQLELQLRPARLQLFYDHLSLGQSQFTTARANDKFSATRTIHGLAVGAAVLSRKLTPCSIQIAREDTRHYNTIAPMCAANSLR